MIVRAAHPDHYPWIMQRSGLAMSAGFRAIEAVDEDGTIHGMVGFDGWTENAVCVHVAIDQKMALRHLVGRAFSVAFNEAGRGLVMAQVLSTNVPSLRLVMKLGFSMLCRIKDGWAKGVDVVWFEMRKENCRWIPAADRKVA